MNGWERFQNGSLTVHWRSTNGTWTVN